MDRVRKIVMTTGIVAMLSAGAVSLLAQAGTGRGAGRSVLAAADLRPASRSVSWT